MKESIRGTKTEIGLFKEVLASLGLNPDLSREETIKLAEFLLPKKTPLSLYWNGPRDYHRFHGSGPQAAYFEEHGEAIKFVLHTWEIVHNSKEPSDFAEYITLEGEDIKGVNVQVHLSQTWKSVEDFIAGDALRKIFIMHRMSLKTKFGEVVHQRKNILAKSTLFNGANLRGVVAYGDFEGANLQSVNFEGADLRGSCLSKANLINSSFSRANLDGCNLCEADVSKANLNEVKLCGSDLTQSKLIETDLRYADLRKVRLSSADLSRANLRGADLTKSSGHSSNLSQVNLSLATLKGADFSWFSLNDANLSDADLSDAKLLESNLCGVNFNGAKFENIDISDSIYNQETRWPKGFDPSQHSIQLIASNANLSEIKFPSNIQDCNLSNLDLSQASFEGRTLCGVNFKGSILCGVNLKGADLRSVNFQDVHLRGAIFDDETKWPDDFDYQNSGAFGPRANLQGCSLEHSDFTSVNLNGANLRGASLQGSKFEGAMYDESTQWPADFDYQKCGALGPRANREGEDLSSRCWYRINLQYISLRKVKLSGSELINVDLSGADLRESNLSDSYFESVNLSGADLSGANLSNISWWGCVFDNETKWPDDFDPVAAGVSVKEE